MEREALKSKLFSKSIKTPNGCIECFCDKTQQGYARISFNGTRMQAHRLSYMLHNNIEALTSKQHICHSCDNPPCINPEHLWLGNAKDNVDDMISKQRGFNQNKTHCPQGHPYSGDNLFVEKTGQRRCKECIKNRCKKYYLNNKEKWRKNND